MSKILNVNFDSKTSQYINLQTMSGEQFQEGVQIEFDNLELTSNASGVAKYELADGQALTYPLAIVHSTGVVTFPLVTDIVYDGETKLQFEFYDGNNVYKSAVYKYVVNRSLGYVNISNSEQQLIQSIVVAENERKTNETERIANENARKSAETSRVNTELLRVSADNSRESRMKNIETRFEALTTSQQQQAEVVDARMNSVNGVEHATLKVRLDSDFDDLVKQQVEVVDARMNSVNGVEHTTLKERLDSDFDDLASKIPQTVPVNGYETVTTNDTLAGDVSGAVATGQTLVNLSTTGVRNITYKDIAYGFRLCPTSLLKLDTKYTLIRNYYDVTSNDPKFSLCDIGIGPTIDIMTAHPIMKINGIANYQFSGMTIPNTYIDVLEFSDLKNMEYMQIRPARGDAVASPEMKYTFSCILIEGDHTDKPLEFFEGLKSAELETVTSHGVNLVDNSKNFLGWGMRDGGDMSQEGVHSGRTTTDFINVKPNTTYKVVKNMYYNEYDYNKTIPCLNATTIYVVSGGTFTTSSNTKFIRFFEDGNDRRDLCLYEDTTNTPTTYIPYQSSTTTLPKTVLRSLPNGVVDTYDFDTQTLTRRCGEVVLNGTESWGDNSDLNNEKTMFFITNIQSSNLSTGCFCDKFTYKGYDEVVVASNTEGITSEVSLKTNLYLRITKSKLATHDVAGFKAWLAQNPTTIVYELETPVVEKIPHDGYLRSYDGQTTLSTDSIVPFKLSANISVDYASVLANTRALAEQLGVENTALLARANDLQAELEVATFNNKVQDNLIDISLMTADELFGLIEPLLETVTLSVNDDESTTKGGVSGMVDAYVAMVMRGLKTIDDVPSRYREEVRRILAELEA